MFRQLFFFSLSLILFAIVQSANGATINVPGDHASIQEAINAAQEGDVVVIAPGNYQERINLQNKNITIRSNSPEDPAVSFTTVINAEGAGPVVTFSGNENEGCILYGLSFTNGSAPAGGAVAGNGARAIIRKCNISNCQATDPTQGGGAVAHFAGLVERSIITQNSSLGYGGAFYTCAGEITSNLLTGNQAALDGGAFYQCTGLLGSNLTAFNSAREGGAMMNCSGTIQNNVMYGNNASQRGGALSNCRGVIQNNTISGNTATVAGGGLNDCDSTTGITTIIRNCIIWDNSSADQPQLANSVTPTYSCIQNWTGGGTGNISADPLFVSQVGNNYRLSNQSPCIDAGVAVDNLKRDIVGNYRPIGSGFDMGAYENTAQSGAMDWDNY